MQNNGRLLRTIYMLLRPMHTILTIMKGKRTIARDATLCDTLLSRTFGLMLSRPRAAILKAGSESIAATTIHTFFMRFAIDAIWLDKNLKVVDIKQNIKPYRFLVAPSRKAMYIAELPAKEKLGIKIGDRLKLSI